MSRIPNNPAHADHRDVLLALEADYGVIAGLTYQGLRCWDFNPVWLDADEKELPYVKQHFGANYTDLLAKRSTVTFKCGLVGRGGDVSGLPPWHALALACGMQHTVAAPTASATIAATATAGAGADGVWTYSRTDAYAGLFDRVVTLTCTTGGGSGVAEFTVAAPAVEYLPAYEETGVVMTTAAEFPLPGGASITPTAITTPFDLGDSYTINLTAAGATYRPMSARESMTSAAIRCLMPDPGGALRAHDLVGCRGSAKLVLNKNDYPYFEVSITSQFTAPAAGPVTTVDYDGWPDPIEVSTDNTPIIRAYGRDLVADMVDVNIGNEVKLVERVGRKGVRILDRKSAATMKVEDPGLDDWNVIGEAAGRATGAIRWQHGVSPGNTLRFDAPRAQLGKPSFSDSDKDRMADLPFKLLPVSGDDEWTLKAL